jgi:hypothetical protein
MTNVSAVAYGDMPLFLFHLLEFMDVDYEIDVEELNTRWSQPSSIDSWSQFVLKQTDDETGVITAAPRSGIWRLAGGGLEFVRRDTDWHAIASEDEAFYLRIAHEGGYRYKGADLGILVSRGRFMEEGHELTPRARAWIQAIKGSFVTAPLPQEAEAPTPTAFGFKML